MPADYTKLKTVLDAAFEQSASGKGAQRHANGKDFDRQPILEIGRMVGPGFALGQAMKKAQESAGQLARGEYLHSKGEMLGAIVYLAAAVVLLGEYAEEAVKAEAAKNASKASASGTNPKVPPGGLRPSLTPLYPAAPAEPMSDLQRAMRRVDDNDPALG